MVVDARASLSLSCWDLVRILLLLMLCLAAPAAAATLSVVNINDAGAGSLRAAITAANDETTNPGADVIAFAIPGAGVPTITLASALPTITAPVTIDGSTQQPGGRVELSGNAMVLNGLVVNTNGTTIRGLVLNRFTSTGITISGDDTVVRGCIIGLNVAANAAAGAVPVGILVGGGARTRIGGTSVADRNVISGTQGSGIWLEGSGTVDSIIEGNFIGTNGAGFSIQLGNRFEGILLGSGTSGNRIGGANPASRNVISANGLLTGGAGVRLRSAGTQGNTVQGNHIGTDLSGTGALGNAIGVNINQAVENVVVDNLISGNATSGIDFESVGGQGNIVRGNRIGTNAGGTADLHNLNAIRINSSNGANLIGGTTPGTGNVIAFNLTGITITSSSNQSIQGNRIGELADGTPAGNLSNAIRITSGTGNRIGDEAGNVIAHNGSASFPAGVLLQGGTKTTVRGNAIYGNLGIGLDLAPAGVTANDAGDADSGANNLQNFPLLDPLLVIDATEATGTFDGAPSATVTIDVYLNTSCDPSGNGEAESHVGSVEVIADETGHAVFSVPLTVTPVEGQVLTATATDADGNTSELSPCTSPATPTTTTSTTTTTIETTSTTGLVSTTTVRTTTTSTTIFRPPTTTLPPEVCDDLFDNDSDGFVDCADINCFGHPSCQEDTSCAGELTLPAMLCRLDTARGTMAAAVDLGKVTAAARGRLEKAREQLIGAQATCRLAKTSGAKRKLGAASRLVRRAEAQLRKRAARGGVPPPRIEELAGGLTPLRDDLSVLRSALACP